MDFIQAAGYPFLAAVVIILLLIAVLWAKTRHVSELEQSLQESSSRAEKLQQDLNGQEQKLNNLSALLQQHAIDLNVANERNAGLTRIQDDLNRRCTMTENAITAWQDKFNSLNSEMAALNSSLEHTAANLEAATQEKQTLDGRLRELQEQYNATAEDNARLSSELSALNKRLEEDGRIRQSLEHDLDTLRAQKETLGSDNSRLESEAAAQSKLLADSKRQRLDLESEVSRLQQERDRLTKENAGLLTKVAAEEQLRTEIEQRRDALNRELEQRLTALGEKMLKERASELSQKSDEQFKVTVDPLQKELAQFRELVTQIQKSSSEQSGTLKNELDKLNQAHLSLTRQADELTQALRGGGKSQGMWGEHQLEKVLEDSGLVLGRDYQREVAGDRAKDEQGRPDAIIRLPHHRDLIIDAKCSLTAYTNYVNAQTKTELDQALKAHLASLRGHINGLARRKYENYESLKSPSFVFMFVPIDHALDAALQNDSDLYNYAQSKNIYLVSPSTLMPALRVVGTLWVLAQQNDKIRMLVDMAGRIYDKASGFRDSLDDAVKAAKALETKLEKANNQFQGGRGNLMTQLENFSRSKAQVDLLDAVEYRSTTGELPQDRPDQPAQLPSPANDAREMAENETPLS